MMYVASLLLGVTSNAAQAVAPPVVVVDPGHGGKDDGASGHGLSEKDLVLTVAKLLSAQLQRQGMTVVLTRSNGDNLVEAAFHGNRQRENLKRRVALAEREKATLYVSIHANDYAGGAAARGAQVFVDKEASVASVRLATLIMDQLRQGTATKRQVNSGRKLYLMEHLKMPCVLVELGFLSNPREAALLGSLAYQKQLARLISNGIAAFIKEPRAQPAPPLAG